MKTLPHGRGSVRTNPWLEPWQCASTERGCRVGFTNGLVVREVRHYGKESLMIGRASRRFLWTFALLAISLVLGTGCANHQRSGWNDVATSALSQEGRSVEARFDAAVLSPDEPAFRTPKRPMKMGPPPPGYIRIRGESVPNWTPVHLRKQTAESAVGLVWQPLGPRPILGEFWSGNDDASGRVVSIATHPTDPDTVYIASASGGVWKTIDGGALWTPLTDELPNLNHGCVALDPTNPETVYVGTGEYTTQTNGDGVFRSTDGGATWVRIATTAQVGVWCSGLIVDPANPLRIHLTGDAGYVRSEDGGVTWTKLLSGRASGLAVDPINTATVFVGRHSDGVYRSQDSGGTFTKLTNGLANNNISRVLVALAPSDPTTVYTAFISGSAGLRGLFKTVDGGNTWVQQNNTPNFPSPQGWYDAFIGVDPTNADVIYAGGVFPTYAVAGVIKSTDGGASWTDITIRPTGQLHPDQHTIAFGATGDLWIGNDGGVWKSADGGASWINRNATLTVTQNYNIAIHPTDPAQVMGGTQDNGTIGRDLSGDMWPQIIGGDGGFLLYDVTQPLRKYTTYVYLTVYRFFGDAFQAEITGPWEAAGDPANFIAPLVMDPNDSRTLLGGTNRVWRTRDADVGANWTAISDTSVGGGGRLNAIAVGTCASDTIYTGSTTGKVFVTTNASTWSDRSTGLPFGQISDILVDPASASTAYVAYHNTSGLRVAKTTNLGGSWTDVTGDLPVGVSARALAVDWRLDPPPLYIGSGAGVYSSTNGGTNWIKDGLDLPNVIIGDLLIDFANGTITAGTFGRGTWRASLIGNFNGDGVIVAQDSLDPASVNLAVAVPCCAPNAQPQPATILSDGGAPVALRTMRMIGVDASSAVAGTRQAIRVTASGLAPPFDVWNGQSMYAGAPGEYSELPGRGFDSPGALAQEATFLSATLQCTPVFMDWSTLGNEVVWLRGEFIVPSTVQPGGGLAAASEYDVQFADELCGVANEGDFGPPMRITSAAWGDIGTLSAGEARAVGDSVGVEEFVFVLQKFSGLGGAAGSGGLPIKARVDMLGVAGGPTPVLDGTITVSETSSIVDAFGGNNYPFTPSTSQVCP